MIWAIFSSIFHNVPLNRCFSIVTKDFNQHHSWTKWTSTGPTNWLTRLTDPETMWSTSILYMCTWCQNNIQVGPLIKKILIVPWKPNNHAMIWTIFGSILHNVPLNWGFKSTSFLNKMNKHVVKYYFFRSIEIAMVFIVKTRRFDQFRCK